MEMVRIVAGVALIGAIFVMLWKKDSTDNEEQLIEGLTTMHEVDHPHLTVETTFLEK